MTLNKPIFLLKYNTNHNLFVKSIYSIFAQKNIDVSCALLLNNNLYKNNNNIYQKIIFFINTNFIDLINDKKLHLIDIYSDDSYLSIIGQNNILNKYNLFFPIESQNIYFPHYAKNIIDFLKNNSSNQTLKVKSFYGIDINNNIINKPNQCNFVYTKESFVNKKTTDYLSQDYITYVPNTNNKLHIIDDNFSLVWVEENQKSELKNSYLFLYKINNKVFNIKNNIHGIIKNIDNNAFTIDWSLNNEYVEYSYRLTDQNTFVNINNE